MTDKPLPGRQPGAWLQDFTRKSELEEKALDDRLATTAPAQAPAQPPAQGGNRSKGAKKGAAASAAAPSADSARLQKEVAALKTQVEKATAENKTLTAKVQELTKAQGDAKGLKAKADAAAKVQAENQALQTRIAELEAAGAAEWPAWALPAAGAWAAVATIAAAVLAFV